MSATQFISTAVHVHLPFPIATSSSAFYSAWHGHVSLASHLFCHICCFCSYFFCPLSVVSPSPFFLVHTVQPSRVVRPLLSRLYSSDHQSRHSHPCSFWYILFSLPEWPGPFSVVCILLTINLVILIPILSGTYCSAFQSGQAPSQSSVFF